MVRPGGERRTRLARPRSGDGRRCRRCRDRLPGPRLPREVMPMLDVGLCAQIACIWEATARKPGNVHRFRDFADTTYTDFLLSAAAIAPAMTMACQQRVGITILESVRSTRRVVGTNTNLGIVLLLAPLASVPPEQEPRSGVERVLTGLDV